MPQIAKKTPSKIDMRPNTSLMARKQIIPSKSSVKIRLGNLIKPNSKIEITISPTILLFKNKQPMNGNVRRSTSRAVRISLVTPLGMVAPKPIANTIRVIMPLHQKERTCRFLPCPLLP